MAFQIPSLSPSMFPSFDAYLSAITDQINAAFLHIPAIQTGKLTETAAGWYTVMFSSAFSSAPKVVAFQSTRTPTSENQSLSPPSFSPSTVPTLSIAGLTLTSLTLPPPPTIPSPTLKALNIGTPTSRFWGTQIYNYLVNNAKSLLSGKFCINLYFASFCIGDILVGAVTDFASIAQSVFNFIEGVYYAFNLPDFITNYLVPAVEGKVSADINTALGNVQSAINQMFYGPGGSPTNITSPSINYTIQTVYSNVQSIINDLVGEANTQLGDFVMNVNTALSKLASSANMALSSLTSVTQDSVNALFELINAAHGLPPGMSIPVIQYRNVTTSSFQIYHPGSDAEVTWIAVSTG